ncbi:hypothetical protein FPQ18DRAFT_265765 [Pyronema domesticum]|nr:hypothetical protein FPQ18DRAFT_265765 [Pyronema domesticum]
MSTHSVHSEPLPTRRRIVRALTEGLEITGAFRNNWRNLLRNKTGELSGAFGDLGTLVPIMVALSSAGCINLPATLVFSGAWNVLSGLIFGIPLPVQPMKALAAVALSRNLTQAETMGAGIGVAAMVMLFALTGTLVKMVDLIPLPIIKGIQVGAGLSLCLTAGNMLSGLELNGTIWYDNLFWAIGAFIFLFGTARWARKVPFTLLIVPVGCLFAGIQMAKDGAELPHWGFNVPLNLQIPTPKEFADGFSIAGLGQVPMTILNSIIAVMFLAKDLLPKQRPPSVTFLGISVGLMNLTGCWFGAMPVCHVGSGGLAAQFRFGARSGISIIILGSIKIVLGLMIGDSMVGLLDRFPKSFLGIMVFAAGMELAAVGQNLNSTAHDLQQLEEEAGIFHDHEATIDPVDKVTEDTRWRVMMVTVGMFLAFHNCFIGFLAGLVAYRMMSAANKKERSKPSWDSDIGSGAVTPHETTPLLSA